MRIRKLVTLTSEEILVALQKTYPALCEGSDFKIFKIDYKGNPDGDPVPRSTGALILTFQADESLEVKK